MRLIPLMGSFLFVCFILLVLANLNTESVVVSSIAFGNIFEYDVGCERRGVLWQ